MDKAIGPDGVKLHVEVTGSGRPLLFIHEFAGDQRSWEPQVRYFSRRYRCITYAARGYPPSDVPESPEAYSQMLAVQDAVAVLDHTGVERAHVIGLSMGAFATLHLCLLHPQRMLSAVVAGCGYGSAPGAQPAWIEETLATARAFEEEGSAAVAARYALGPSRVQFRNKDPRGWAEFAARLAEHSAPGSALTLRGIQMRRPNLYDLRSELSQVTVPTLLLTGDEDEGSLEPSLMLKRTMPGSGLAVMPRTGHTCNLEEPDLFNRLVQDFLTEVESGRWTLRDPRSLGAGLTGMGPGIAFPPGRPRPAGSPPT